MVALILGEIPSTCWDLIHDAHGSLSQSGGGGRSGESCEGAG